jgi:hypothetical protein
LTLMPDKIVKRVVNEMFCLLLVESGLSL